MDKSAYFNEIYFSYLNKTCCENELLKKIIKEIYFSPEKFGIFKLKKDDIGNFIIFLYPNLKKIFLTYDPNKTSFYSYVKYKVFMNYKSYKKNKIIEYINNHNNVDCVSESYITDKYNEYEETKINNAIYDAYDYNDTKKIIFNNLKINKKQLLFICLKYSYYLNEKMIKKMAYILEIDEEILWNYKLICENTLEKKIHNFNKRIQSINRSFYYKYKYNYILSFLDYNDYLLSTENFKNSYVFQNNRWKKYIDEVPSVLVSNKHIQKLLGVSDYFAKITMKKLKFLQEYCNI